MEVVDKEASCVQFNISYSVFSLSSAQSGNFIET